MCQRRGDSLVCRGGFSALVLAAVGGIGWGSPAAFSGDAPGGSPPNIVFIFTDDHARHAVGAYGSRINETPHLDRLAGEGMLFRNAFVGNSICSPSRATVLTGLHSHLNGVLTNREPFDGSQRTFPKLLREAGYETALVGKWHLESEPTGFDHWAVLYGQGPYYNPPIRTADGRVEYEGYTTDIITDLTIDWLENERDPSKPFMIMSQHKAPHRNWMPGPDHLTLYDDVMIPEPPTLFDDQAGRGTAARVQEMTLAEHMSLYWDLKLSPDESVAAGEGGMREGYRNLLGRMTGEQRSAWEAAYGPKNDAFLAAGLRGRDRVRWKYQRYVKDYLRTIASVDDNVGRLMEYLETSGLANDTIVIYTSDQGFYLGDHGWYDKRFMYEESLTIPLIVRWPGVTEPGSESRALVQNLDFAPTFLTVAGVEAPEKMQGRSLEPLLRGEDPQDWRDAVYYHYYEGPPAVHGVHRHYGIRTDRYKLMHFYELEEWELYDLQRDPEELNDLYEHPFYREIRNGLVDRLRELQERYGDTDPHAPLSELRQAGLRRRLMEEPVATELVMQLADRRSDAPERPDPSRKPFTVGARCIPEAGDGVLVARGGESVGFVLHIRDGIPRFSTRSSGELRTVSADRTVALGEPVHLAGMLDHEGRLRLYIDGKLAATAPGFILESEPYVGLSIGGDATSLVGDYSEDPGFSGEMTDIRLYWGELSESELNRWAQR